MGKRVKDVRRDLDAKKDPSVRRADKEARLQARKARQKERWSVPAAELTRLSVQLAPLGLVLRDVKGDGNCLFRALSDQLYGDEAHHGDLRAAVTDYITQQRAFFEPFRESEKEDETFEEYVEAMRQDGVYVGNWALAAFSRLHKATVAIHQVGQPVWYMHPEGVATRTLHVAYFGYEHYSSVRAENDRAGPANVQLKPAEDAIALSSEPANKANAAVEAVKSVGKKAARAVMSKQQQRAVRKAATKEGDMTADKERIVREATGVQDPGRIRDALEQFGNDINEAINSIIVEEVAMSGS